MVKFDVQGTGHQERLCLEDQGIQIGDNSAILTCKLGIAGNGGVELTFKGLLLFDGMKALQTFGFADPFFPGIGDTGLFGGIGDAQTRAFGHGFVDDLEAFVTHGNRPWIHFLRNELDHFAVQILLCLPRETIDHGKITRFCALERYRQGMTGSIGFVVCRIRRGLIVGIGVDAKH